MYIYIYKLFIYPSVCIYIYIIHSSGHFAWFFVPTKKEIAVQSQGSWRPWSGVHLLSLQQWGSVRQAPRIQASWASWASPGCHKFKKKT